MSGSSPGDEIPHLSIVPIVCQEQLGADQEYFSIQGKDTAVESVIAMHNRHANVQKNTVARLVPENPHEHLPAVEIQVCLQKVIEAPIATDFQFWTNSQLCPYSFRFADAFNNAGRVALEIKRPLICKYESPNRRARAEPRDLLRLQVARVTR